MKTTIITNDYPTHKDMHIMQTMSHNPLRGRIVILIDFKISEV